MTTAERETAEQAIRTYLERLDGLALEQICTAERWCTGLTVDSQDHGRRCLVGHGSGCEFRASLSAVLANPEAARAFMDLCAAQGIDRTVAGIQFAASVLIATRAAAAVAALCGEG